MGITMDDFLIGRQQIFDRDQNIFGYELLFRHASGMGALAFGNTAASNQVIVDSLLEQGLDKVIGPHRAFINFTRENILSGTAALLPKERVVIEILEDVIIDDTLIEVVQQLVKNGYTIALDDFVFDEKWIPLIKLAKIIKFDVQLTGHKKCRSIIEHFSSLSIHFLAEKVETQEQFREYYDIGCHYYQGFLFSKPNILKGKRLGANQVAVLQLLSKINNPSSPFDEVVRTISMDVGLCYKLLRYINSAFFSLPRKIDSISYAVTYLGLHEVRRWASLMLLANCADKPKEFINIALVRAKMCELLAKQKKLQNTDQFFLVGMMSTIDQLLDTTMEEAV
jgi:EAL and modified HD-GYP domain-containing signal transduction protein